MAPIVLPSRLTRFLPPPKIRISKEIVISTDPERVEWMLTASS
jgi:hypothetical protein